MATVNLDTVTGIFWYVNYTWDTTAHTGGQIIHIKYKEEDGNIKDGIIWDVDQSWVLMSLTGEETLSIQYNEDNSGKVDEVQEGGQRSPSESVLIDDIEPREELSQDNNHMVRMASFLDLI